MVFPDMPGRERLASYLRGRARREMAKLSDEKFEFSLQYLEQLMRAVRTGENWDQVRDVFVKIRTAQKEGEAA